uniref:Putative Polycomb group protein ASXL1 n=1 Tax=Hydra vulgaris TaxID=6087 RepID=T2M9W9_HYDVU
MNKETDPDRSSSDECNDEDKTSKDKMFKKSKSEGNMTWAEAAEKVLSNFDYPLPHKDILKHIQEGNLKQVGRGHSAPLAVLNSMLNSHSRGPDAVFYRAEGAACFGLNKNRTKTHEVDTHLKPLDVQSSSLRNRSSLITFDSLRSAKTYVEFKKEKEEKEQKYNPPRALKIPGEISNLSTSHPKKQLIPPGNDYDSSKRSDNNLPIIGSLSKEAYDRLKQYPHHRRMGPTTSALVRPAPPFSRPPPGAALRVMPPKKRIKLEDDNEEKLNCTPNVSKNISLDVSKNTSLDVSKNTSQSVSKNSSLNVSKNSPLNVFKNSSLNVSKTSSLNVFKNNTLNVSKNNTLNVSKNNTLNVSKNNPMNISKNTALNLTKNANLCLPKRTDIIKKEQIIKTDNKKNEKLVRREVIKMENVRRSSPVNQKVLKSNANQIKRSKDGKLDLMRPDSILTSIHLKDCINERTFNSLPPAYQYQLLMLLPDVDRKIDKDGALRLSAHALTNEFFTRACQDYKDKLLDGEFNSDILQRAKNEVRFQTKLDPWKVKFFEPVYGISSSNNDAGNDVILQPIESSWVTFLKFAENSTADFDEALKKIQSEVKRDAKSFHTDFIEKNEKEDRDWLLPKSAVKDRSNCSRTSSRHLNMLSPLTLKPKTITEDFMKSRRAIKKAQLLQRKKFDKQLKDAKAKIVEDARCGSLKVDNLKVQKLNENVINDKNISAKTVSSLDLLARNGILTCPPEDNCNLTVDCTIKLNNSLEDKTISDNIKNQNVGILDLCDNSVLKNLIHKKNELKPTPKLKNARRKAVKGPFKSEITRILHGPASFGTNDEGKCSCNLSPMAVCIRCGSFWHGESLDSDSNCVLCTS